MDRRIGNRAKETIRRRGQKKKKKDKDAARIFWEVEIAGQKKKKVGLSGRGNRVIEIGSLKKFKNDSTGGRKGAGGQRRLGGNHYGERTKHCTGKGNRKQNARPTGRDH